ncbi:MAG TPA: MauE/DoxX family redox-associated membrane protein [Micromonosporaceae bacterium]
MSVTLTTTESGPGIRWRTLRPWLGTVVRLGLAAVWLYAGASKVGDLAASGRAVHAYQLMPYEVAKVVGAALPFVELGLGVLLLLGVATRLSAVVSTLLLVAFIVGIVSAWARDLAIDCGCFGTGGELPPGESPSYWLDLLRDLGFLLLAGFLVIWPVTRISIDEWLASAPEAEEGDE